MHLPYCIIYNSGNLWYLNGKFHRENGPALDPDIGAKNRTKWWFVHGKKHRIDGPAIERIDGNNAWYYNDEFIDCYSQEEFEQLLRLKAFW